MGDLGAFSWGGYSGDFTQDSTRDIIHLNLLGEQAVLGAISGTINLSRYRRLTQTLETEKVERQFRVANRKQSADIEW